MVGCCWWESTLSPTGSFMAELTTSIHRFSLWSWSCGNWKNLKTFHSKFISLICCYFRVNQSSPSGYIHSFSHFLFKANVQWSCGCSLICSAGKRPEIIWVPVTCDRLVHLFVEPGHCCWVLPEAIKVRDIKNRWMDKMWNVAFKTCRKFIYLIATTQQSWF